MSKYGVDWDKFRLDENHDYPRLPKRVLPPQVTVQWCGCKFDLEWYATCHTDDPVCCIATRHRVSKYCRDNHDNEGGKVLSELLAHIADRKVVGENIYER